MEVDKTCCLIGMIDKQGTKEAIIIGDKNHKYIWYNKNNLL